MKQVPKLVPLDISKSEATSNIYELDEDFGIEETPELLDSKVDYIFHLQQRELARGRVVTNFKGPSREVLLKKIKCSGVDQYFYSR